MKILLASNGKFLIEGGLDLFGIPKDKIRIGRITTASKGNDNKDYIERHRKECTDNGYFLEDIDIEGKTEEEIFKFFQDKNIVHIEGGNTFYLLREVKKTRFDEILKKLFEKGIGYVGTSAGAYIMCPNIKVSTLGPNPKPRYGLEDLTGLDYVPFCLKVHYTDEMEANVKEMMKNIEHPQRILRDGQGILCEDGVCKFYGKGEEVILK